MDQQPALPEIRRLRLGMDFRPTSATTAAWLIFLTGIVGCYATFAALGPLPARAFVRGLKLESLIACCGSVPVIGVVLQCGVLGGRRWAWLGAVNWALFVALATGWSLGSRIKSGVPPWTAASLAPHHAFLFVCSLLILGLLMSPGARRWCFTARPFS